MGALLVAPPASATTTFRPPPSVPDVLKPRDLLRIRRITLERSLLDLGVSPQAIELLRDDQRVRTGRWMLAEPAGDLNGDGTGDVFESDTRYRITVGNGGGPAPEDEVTTIVTARDGATGKRIWRRKYDTDVWPVAWRVGPEGRPGALLIGNVSSALDPSGSTTLSFRAVNGERGRTVWNRTYTSTYTDSVVTWVAANQLVSFGRFDALEGRADELMIGLSTMVGSLLSSSAATTTVVVDGRDGTEHAHPLIDVGVGWVPIPGDVGDLDRDGFDDVVTTNNPGIDPGEEQEPPVVGPMVYARKGSDGSPIWSESVPMDYFAFAWDVSDVAGSRTPEVGLETVQRNQWHVYLLDGDYGTSWWDRRADWMHAPGDIDRDGRRDVVLTRWYAGMGTGKMRIEQDALRGSGAEIWSRRTVWDYEELPCPRDACSTWMGFGADVRGDVDADGVTDMAVSMAVGLGAVVADATALVFDGRSGRTVYETGAELSATGVAMDRRGDDMTRFTVASNRMTLEGVDGRGRKLWGGTLMGPRKVLPRNTSHFSFGMRLGGDSCGDVLVDVFDGDDTFYAVIDGGSGRILWSRWSGARSEHPAFAVNRDLNRAC